MENARLHSLEHQVTFYQGDLFDPIDDLLRSRVDLLVSNPPYIPTHKIPNLQREVRYYEPTLALDGGEDGLDYYRRIIQEGEKFLSPRGCLILEIGHDQGARVAELLKCKKRLRDVIIVDDLAGIGRVVRARVKERD